MNSKQTNKTVTERNNFNVTFCNMQVFRIYSYKTLCYIKLESLEKNSCNISKHRFVLRLVL